MKTKTNLNKDKFYIIIFIFIIIFVSTIIGYRASHIGTDTENYIFIYENINSSIISSRYEIGFLFLAKTVSKLGGSHQNLFSIISLFVTFFMYMTFLRFSEYKNTNQLIVFSCLFFSLLFTSNWYYTGVVNALRHSMSLSLLYYSISFLKDNRKYQFLIYFILSCLFHQSSILFIPFIVILKSKKLTLKSSTYSFLLFGVGYYFGINEYIVKLISDVSQLGLYEIVRTYGQEAWGEVLWEGFNIKFFIYNNFWYFLPFLLYRLRLIDLNENLIFLIKLYSLLCIYYFIFGFGGFSNRWAYPSWLILPILQGYLISNLKVNSHIKIALSLTLVLSTLYFINRIKEFI